MVGLQHSSVGWAMNLGRIDYDRALSWQRGLVKMRREGLSRDIIMLVEHPPVVTVGRSAHKENFEGLSAQPVFIERGGDVTYHGPGQLVAYFIFNLSRRGKNLRKFMTNIQTGVIDTLKEYNISAKRGNEHTGIWVGEHKIASIGIAVKNWITFHGVAINLNTNLAEFEQINPCGLSATIMTSVLKETGKKVSLDKFGEKLLKNYDRLFDTTFESIKLDELAEEIESQRGSDVI